MTERPNIIEAAHLFRAGPPLRVVSDNPLYAGIERVSQRATGKILYTQPVQRPGDEGPRAA